MRDIYTFPWINPYVHLSNELPEYLHNCRGKLPTDAEATMLRERFNGKRIVMELGSGSGQHLIAQAERHPDIFFIGVEIRFKRAYRTAEKAARKNLRNIFIIRGDAVLMKKIFATPDLAPSIEGIYINFPDPWQRQKWKKNRLISEDFIPLYALCLQANGFLRLKTDHQEFFESSEKLLQATDTFIVSNRSTDLYQSDALDQNIPTEFEQLFRSQNLPIFFLEAIRNVTPFVQI